jgi:hypothetical protein
MLLTQEERLVFLQQLRLNNFGPQATKRSGLRPPARQPPPPGPDPGPGPSSAGPRVVATVNPKKK